MINDYGRKYLIIMQEDKKSQISINIVQVLLFCDFGSSLFK